MRNFLVRFVPSFSLGLALTACAAAPRTDPASPGDRSAVTPGRPTTIPTASPSASHGAPSSADANADGGIVIPSTTSIVVRVLAALTPPNPPGPAHCDYNALYTLNLKTHELSWEFCFVSEKGKRTLQPPEIAMLDAALARLKVVQDGDMCFPDAPTISVTTTGDATREYHGDVCGPVPPLLGFEATGKLTDALYKLTGN